MERVMQAGEIAFEVEAKIYTYLPANVLYLTACSACAVLPRLQKNMLTG